MAEQVKTQRRIALSADEMRSYLETKGVICNTTNHVFVENLYNAVRVMSFSPDKKISVVITQSQATLLILDMTKIVDMIMGRIGQRIRRFDVVGEYKISIESIQQTLNKYIYYNHKFEELGNFSSKILEEAINDKLIDSRRLPYSIKRRLKALEIAKDLLG